MCRLMNGGLCYKGYFIGYSIVPFRGIYTPIYTLYSVFTPPSQGYRLLLSSQRTGYYFLSREDHQLNYRMMMSPLKF